MTTWTVTLENYEGKCKRVKIEAASPTDAMATASMKYRGWMPVDVE